MRRAAGRRGGRARARRQDTLTAHAVKYESFPASALSSKPPAPTVTGFTPASGAVGSSVTVNGTNLSGTSAVSFNGTAATTSSVVSATQINATVPAGATGSGPIIVTTPGGTATSATNFAVASSGGGGGAA